MFISVRKKEIEKTLDTFQLVLQSKEKQQDKVMDCLKEIVESIASSIVNKTDSRKIGFKYEG